MDLHKAIEEVTHKGVLMKTSNVTLKWRSLLRIRKMRRETPEGIKWPFAMMKRSDYVGAGQ